MKRDARSELMFAYTVAVVFALVAAFIFALVCDWGVHRSGNGTLLLLPISNVRFWFIPFAAGGCAIVATAHGRPRLALLVATLLFAILSVISTVRWYRVGVLLGPNWTAAERASVMRNVDVTVVVLGFLTLFGLGVFLLGMRDSLKGHVPVSPSRP
jgi:hypothetical protein